MKLKVAPALDPFDRNPLLGGSIWLENADSWRSRIESYYDPTAGKKGKKKASVPKPCVVSKTKIGSVVFRIKRDPKFITESELQSYGQALDIGVEELTALATKRKIEIRKEETDGKSNMGKDDGK